MATNDKFGSSSLFLSDARLALAVANHLRYQALGKAFGVSREQANVLTLVLLMGAAEGVVEVGRKIGGLRPHVSSTDAALGGLALREAALSVAGPSVRAVPGLGTLVAIGVLGGLAAPSLRRLAHRTRLAEQRLRAAEARVRQERIRRYVAARDRVRATA